ncbi:MAG: hypothetical protein U1F39_03975 [Steroidobacteraceae bacterium]
MKRQILGGILATGLTCVGWAGPSDYVYVPTVEYGERELDFKYGSASAGGPDEHAASLGFGLGATRWWFTELYIKYKREEGRTFLDAFEWENKFQLTETGKYPVDVGWLVELERPQDRDEGYELKLGPLFQTEFGRLQLNTNILLERVFDSLGSNGTSLGYQWQAKYRWREALEFGAQGFGEMGDWTHWAPADEQNHRLGPAVFGKIALGGRQAIRYNAALLMGLGKGAPDRTLRLQVEYEF